MTFADGERCAQRLVRTKGALFDLGLRGTPAFFINGRYLAGAQPIEAFRKPIDDELQAKKPAG